MGLLTVNSVCSLYHGHPRCGAFLTALSGTAAGEACTLSGVGGPYLNLSSAHFPLGSCSVCAGSVPASVKWGDNLYLSGSLRLHEMIPVVSVWHMAITPQVVTSRMITRRRGKGCPVSGKSQKCFLEAQKKASSGASAFGKRGGRR